MRGLKSTQLARDPVDVVRYLIGVTTKVTDSARFPMCSLFTDTQIRQVSKLPNLGDDVALETERVTWPLETERVTWQ